MHYIRPTALVRCAFAARSRASTESCPRRPVRERRWQREAAQRPCPAHALGCAGSSKASSSPFQVSLFTASRVRVWLGDQVTRLPGCQVARHQGMPTQMCTNDKCMLRFLARISWCKPPGDPPGTHHLPTYLPTYPNMVGVTADTSPHPDTCEHCE